MNRIAHLTLVGVLIVVGCGTKPQAQRPAEDPRRGTTPPAQPAPRPRRTTHPLDRRASFAFHDVPLPDAISQLSREPGVPIGVSPTIPIEEWRKHRVTLRMADVTVRAFLDWLVRPLRAEYAIEADGGAWLTRGDELLEAEPIELRTYRVPTHLVTRVPVRGALVFEQEQRAVVSTLHACLRYLEDRRSDCRLEFHGSADLLVARLPARGHARVVDVLEAMRYGGPPRSSPLPSMAGLRAKLTETFEWRWPPAPADRTLARIAQVAQVNLGCDPRGLDKHEVTIPQGSHTLAAMLDAVVRQSRLARYALEPDHGIWLHAEGEDAHFLSSGAVPWDRAFVQAYEIQPLLGRVAPEALLTQLRKRVDPAQWATGIPAAAVFVAAGRLIVVHDEAGHRRAAQVVHEMLSRSGSGTATGEKGR